MIQSEQNIPCPVCKTGIPFDPRQLVMGTQFVCPGCGAGVGLAMESRELVDKALTAFEMERAKLAGRSK